MKFSWSTTVFSGSGPSQITALSPVQLMLKSEPGCRMTSSIVLDTMVGGDSPQVTERQCGKHEGKLWENKSRRDVTRFLTLFHSGLPETSASRTPPKTMHVLASSMTMDVQACRDRKVSCSVNKRAQLFVVVFVLSDKAWYNCLHHLSQLTT